LTPSPDNSLGTLKKVLVNAGFTAEAIGRSAPFASTPSNDPIARAMERTSEPTVFNTLLRLFVIGGTVSPAAATEALAPLAVDDLVAAGVLDVSDGGVTAVFAIDPFGDLLIVNDFRDRCRMRGETRDAVLGIGASTRLVAGITVRRGGERVLDIGTGQGFQAALAAGHAREVIATDINARALRAARMTAAVNGYEIDFREGSLFEPVVGMKGRFDLIVSNPAYVVAPRHDVVAFSGDAQDNSLVEQVFRQIPDYLCEGGYGCLMGSWGHQDERDWSDRPRRWLANAGCDLLLIRSRAQSARQYATQWIDESEGIAGIGSTPPLPVWLEYFERLGLGAFSTCAAVIRKRRGGSNWTATEACLEQRVSQAGDQVQRLFAGRTHLSELARPEQVLDSRLVFTGPHEIVDRRRATGGQWRSASTTLRQTDGFEFSVAVDTAAASLLAALDGARTPRQVITSMASARGGDIGRAMVQTAPLLRRMLELGYVTPAAG
jgi:SAM-dependent methyltransferase